MTPTTANHHHHGQNDCKDRVPVIEFSGFGKAYVPQQELCELYPGKTGFIRGTIFPELDIPYEPRWGNNTEGGDDIG